VAADPLLPQKEVRGFLLFRRLMRRRLVAALRRPFVVSTCRMGWSLRHARTASRTRPSILITWYRAVRAGSAAGKPDACLLLVQSVEGRQGCAGEPVSRFCRRVAAAILAVADAGVVEQHIRWRAVMKIAAHANPVRRPTPSFMLRASLEDIEREGNYEHLWTKRVGEDRFELCCIPFFAYDLALGDVVRADAGTGWVLQSVEKRSGNGVVRVAVKRREDVDAIHLRLHDLLGKLEYLHEWFAPGYVAVSLEPGRSHAEFFGDLAALGDAVEVERILV
jgi:hypothetical protein